MIYLGENKKLRQMFRMAFSLWSEKMNGYYFKCMGLLYEIFYEINNQQYTSKQKYSIIEPAVSYISKNYRETTIKIPRLAKLCCISESYLKQIFKEIYNLSPKRYIMNLKAEYAVELLSSNMYSVSEISELLGFESVCYFSYFFKQELGVSPSDYMNKCKSSK